MSSPEWRYILHADLDAFYASVEQLDDPSLSGKPVVVGGPPEARGVVAAASYAARKFGVHSAMPMRTALRLCPSLVRVQPRFDRYREMSRKVQAMFRDVTPLVEPLSLDEAYLDVSRQSSAETVRDVAAGLKARVRQEAGLAVTIGGGASKTVAKVASRRGKPDGLLLVMPGEERAFLAPLDVDALWGVGPKTAAALKQHGVNTVAELSACSEEWLRQSFGRRGPELKLRAVGIDNEPVVTERETKSVSAETTMPQDVSDRAALERELEELVREVAGRLRGHALKGRVVHVKLRLSDFTTLTRQRRLLVPTDDPAVILRAACELLGREVAPGRRFRLIGVGVSGFEESLQLALLPP